MQTKIDTDKTCQNAGKHLTQSEQSAPHIVPDLTLVEVIQRDADVVNRLKTLGSESKKEVNSFISGKAPTRTQIQQFQDRNLDMYARGVRSRAIYESKVRDHRVFLDHVRWLNERGSEVRTVPHLPLQMIVADKRIAVVRLYPSGGRPGIIVHRSETTVFALQTLFELVWVSASPLGAILSNDGEAVTFDERALIELLSLGRQDKEVAAALAVSERTVERRVATLMNRLNARTRFAAGVQAVKSNWI